MINDRSLNYDYAYSMAYCKEIGLVWLGDDFIRQADIDAKANNFTQAQVNIAMTHHLWQVKWLFTPKNYKFYQSIIIAAYFLFGYMPKGAK